MKGCTKESTGSTRAVSSEPECHACKPDVQGRDLLPGASAANAQISRHMERLAALRRRRRRLSRARRLAPAATAGWATAAATTAGGGVRPWASRRASQSLSESDSAAGKGTTGAPAGRGVLPISDQKDLILSAFACTPCPRVSGTSLSGCGGGAGGGTGGTTIGVSRCAVTDGISSSRRVSMGGPGIAVSVPTSKFHFVPRASTVSRRLQCSPGGFLRTDLHLSTPNFVPTRCSSDDASHPHQQPLIHRFDSLAARTSWSGINANTDSPNMHKGETYGVPSKYRNGVLQSRSHCKSSEHKSCVTNCKWNGR